MQKRPQLIPLTVLWVTAALACSGTPVGFSRPADDAGPAALADADTAPIDAGIDAGDNLGRDAGSDMLNDAGPAAPADAGTAPIDAGIDDAGIDDAGIDAGDNMAIDPCTELRDAGTDAGDASDAGTPECFPDVTCIQGPAAPSDNLLCATGCSAGSICSPPGICVPPRYDLSHAGVVTDLETGLIWQRDSTPDEPYGFDYSLSGAEAYCQALQLGGYGSGWRLPTIQELFSLVDRRFTPTIDTSVFVDVNQFRIVFLSSSSSTTHPDL